MKMPLNKSSIVQGRELTFVDVLQQRAANLTQRTAYIFLPEDNLNRASITFVELDRRARAVACFLSSLKMQGERAMVLLPSGLDYISTFYGCLYAGVIAIPGHPPHFGRRRQETWLEMVANDAAPTVAFASAAVIRKVGETTYPNIRWIDPESIDISLAEDWRRPQLTTETPAFLQYTSGSTSRAKGVIVSHGNILENQRIIQTVCKDDQESTVVGWLPFYHDMGLVGTVLHPAYLGTTSVLMPPARFLRDPFCWLQTISQYKGHSSSAPNFAYDLCCRKITEEQKQGLDLSNWQVAVNGAEPVRYETMERFVDAFGQCGFKASAFVPSYGLAESTLMVTGGKTTTEAPVIKKLSMQALEQNLVRKPEEGEAARCFVGCGHTQPGQEIRIVDPGTLELQSEENVGEIWVRGGSVAQGYWNQPEVSQEIFQARIPSTGEAPFLRSGDLGFLSNGQLFVTGRLKDLIIIRGRNLYPQDIELTVENSHTCLRPNCCAAFTVESANQDELVVVAELERHTNLELKDVITAIQEAVVLEHGIRVHTAVLIKSNTIPKTTSGKVRRSNCRELFLADKLDKITAHTFVLTDSEPLADEAMFMRAEVLETAPEFRQELLQSRLKSYLARLLNIDSAEMTSEKPLVALGVDSLAAVQLRNAIETGLHVQLNTVDFLSGSNLSEVSAIIIERLEKSEDLRPQEEIAKEAAEHPLTPGQRGLWILYQAAPHSAAYTLANAVRVQGALNVAALERSFRQLMVRHPMLRTVFQLRDGEPIQRILPHSALSFGYHFQYRDLASAEPNSITEPVAEAVRQPFSLESNPPIRLHVFHVSAQEHVFVLALHHIIADLWSLEVFLEEFAALYSSEIKTQTSDLPEMQATYIDFARWQEKNMDGERAKVLLDYWLTHLSGELPTLLLPADHPRPQAPSYRGASEAICFKPDLFGKIEERAREAGVTPFMVVLAAFQILLHRICGQNDLLVGTPTNGRSKAEFSRVIGYFVNPVVLRSQYDGQITFESYLETTKQTVLKAFEFQDCPFPLLVEKLQPVRDGSIAPIFQTFFVWQTPQDENGKALGAIAIGEPAVPLAFSDLHVESIPLANTGSQFDVTLMMTARGKDLLGVLKYSTSLFDAGTIQRLGKQLSVLLEGIVADPTMSVSSLPLMTGEERAALIHGWHAAASVHDYGERCIYQLFEENAERHPERTALIVGEKQVSYAELNMRANRFAHYLRSLGVTSEVRVGIYLNRTVELIAAILGIWKAGGAYVSFDPRDPKERLAGLVKTSAIHVLITHEQLLERLPEELPQMVLLDLDLDLIALEASTNTGIMLPQQSLAYMIYTSGSTGEPKGTMIQHGSLMNLLSALQETIYDQYKEVPLKVGLNAPIAFDGSVKQLLALAMGHTLCLVLEDIRRNGEALLSYVEEASLDVMDCTPTQFELLLEAGFSSKRRKVTLLVGGEPVSQRIWEELSRAAEACYNVYGPTECTVDASICRIGATASPSIGTPLPGVPVYLLDQQLEPLPTGVAGEMFIGGNSVGRGYAGQPALTAEKFLPDPFSRVAGARMYRSGDRARYAADGKLQFIGRTDRQVKIRGFRIELGEIEKALLQCADVLDSAVTVNENKQIIAYVVSASERGSNQYREFLAQRVPEYMIPAAVVTVPLIPVNPNGKRDYAALPRPEAGIMERGDDYVSPQSPVEEYLAELWAEVLRVQPIGIHDNFFALGGDSLQATRVISQVQEKYQTDTPLLAAFFQEPTVAALAQVLTSSYQRTPAVISV